MSTPKRDQDPTITTSPDDPDHIDELLDEAIEESFPASDPVSISIERCEDGKPARSESPQRPDPDPVAPAR